jgi:hypothetical protein
VEPLLKGMQIVARKTLAENWAELKVKMNADPIPNSKQEMPAFMIQPMVKVGNEWKLGGSTRGYRDGDKWEQDGQVEMLTP